MSFCGSRHVRSLRSLTQGGRGEGVGFRCRTLGHGIVRRLLGVLGILGVLDKGDSGVGARVMV